MLVTGDIPSIRHFHAAAVVNNTMYIYGGFGGKNMDDMFKFDFSTATLVDLLLVLITDSTFFDSYQTVDRNQTGWRSTCAKERTLNGGIWR